MIDITPEETFSSAIVGWRVWRLLEIDTLEGGKSLRLAAAGTLGNPRFWEPGQATVASCSVFDATHEAPWPDCGCGLYALRTRRLNEERLASFAKFNENGSVAWVVGRVSLWGRVVECERGWRGQYAYPYTLTVLAEDESLAPRLRSLYAVDVETAPQPKRPSSAERIAATRSKLEELKKAIEDLEAEASEPPGENDEEETEGDDEEDQVDYPVIPSSVGREDVLRSYYLVSAWMLDESCSDRYLASHNLFELGALRLVLLWQRDWPSPYIFGRKYPAEVLDGLDDFERSLRGELRRLRRDGLVESDRKNSDSTRYYRLTAAGLEAVEALKLPTALRIVEWGAGSWKDPHVVRTLRVSRTKTLERMRRRPGLFLRELEAWKPKLAAERAAARARGEASLRRHLARRRRPDEFGEIRVYWTAEEVLAALNEAYQLNDRQPVAFHELMATLGPGKYGREEAARTSIVLVKLLRAGQVKQVQGRNIKLWRPTDA
jgi:DNA-binding PadR family transcriptional regulator